MPGHLPLHRYVLLSRPFCFEPSTPYEVTVRLQRAGVTQRHPSAFILIDSVRGGLLPHAWGSAGVGDHGLGWEVTPVWAACGVGMERWDGNRDRMVKEMGIGI